MFPLGNMLKSHDKQIVYEEGIVSPEEGESQDLCFVSDGNVFSIVTQRRPELLKDGDIVTMDGKVLGRHRGAFAHTIGQRRGLGLGGGPWFVVKVDIAENKVIVGRQEDLNCRHVHLSGMNWLREMPASTVRVEAQLRYLMKPRKAMLAPAGDNEAELIFEEDAPLAPEGQLAVAYDGDSVVASGWIMSSE
jgi:tRNA-specific 2-thiouridylase